MEKNNMTNEELSKGVAALVLTIVSTLKLEKKVKGSATVIASMVSGAMREWLESGMTIENFLYGAGMSQEGVEIVSHLRVEKMEKQ